MGVRSEEAVVSLRGGCMGWNRMGRDGVCLVMCGVRLLTSMPVDVERGGGK